MVIDRRTLFDQLRNAQADLDDANKVIDAHMAGGRATSEQLKSAAIKAKLANEKYKAAGRALQADDRIRKQ